MTRFDLKFTKIYPKPNRIDLKSNRIDVKSNRNDLKLNRNDLKSNSYCLKVTKINLETTRMDLKSSKIDMKLTNNNLKSIYLCQFFSQYPLLYGLKWLVWSYKFALMNIKCISNNPGTNFELYGLKMAKFKHENHQNDDPWENKKVLFFSQYPLHGLKGLIKFIYG